MCHSFYVLGINYLALKLMAVKNDIAHYLLYAYKIKRYCKNKRSQYYTTSNIFLQNMYILLPRNHMKKIFLVKFLHYIS